MTWHMFRVAPLQLSLGTIPVASRVITEARTIRTALFGEAPQNAKPFREGYQLRQRLNAHLFHHSVPVSLDGAFRRSQHLRNLLVDLAAHDKLEDLMLARRQGVEQC